MTVTKRAAVERAGLERILGWHEAREAGPTLVVVGGVHANEPAGLIAAERTHRALLDGDDGRGPRLRRGRVVMARGNLTALGVAADEPWRRPRYIDQDLNRMFVGGRGGGAEAAERDELAATLASIASTATGPTHVLDLHTVSSESPAFVAVEDSLAARRFAMGFPLTKLLGIEEELSGLLMDYATNELGCVSCVVEGGRHDDPCSVDVHEGVILLAMRNLGLCDAAVRLRDGREPSAVVASAAGGRDGHVYDVRERVAIRTPGFRMAPGAVAFGAVRAFSSVVAFEGGDDAVRPEVSGLLFMPNRQARPRVGDDAFFVVRRVGRSWLGVSAWLRRRRWLHRAAPFVLPGVRRRPGHSNDLLIAPEIAAVFRREVFHLLGYRIVRRTPTARRRGLSAIVSVLAAVAGAGRRIAAGVFRGGERGVLPVERSADWVVRRRRLDVDPPGPGDRSGAEVGARWGLDGPIRADR